MWTTNPRYLLDIEKLWINKFERGWPDEYLNAIRVVDFIVDNAHTIRNAELALENVKVIASELTNDQDGAPIDVILYETRIGGFGELEFNRLDAQPLLAIPKPGP
jgi:hypothetical protein